MKTIYIRTSSKEQEPQLQLKDISSLIDISSCEVIEEKQSAFKDAIKQRPLFNILYNQILKGEVKELYVWDLDRLYRDRVKLKEFFVLCKNRNCKIYSYRQSWLTSINKIPNPWNDIVMSLLIDIIGWIAEEESQKKSERIKNAVIKKDGSKTKSYKGNNWGRKSLPKQTRDRIIELHLENKSIREIASIVKTTDKNKNQKPVSKSVVHKTITEYNTENKNINDVLKPNTQYKTNNLNNSNKKSNGSKNDKNGVVL